MNQETEAQRTFEVEGETVRFFELDGHRLSHCGCATFQDRLSRLGEGFCGHTVVAITRCLQGQPENPDSRST